jgi:rhamnulokinase
MAPRIFAAVDLGASGGRVMAGVVDGDAVRVEEVHRFPNGATSLDGHLRWPFTALEAEVRTGLAQLTEAESIGIDTWGVDYGLLATDGRLLAEPIAHRDDRTTDVIDEIHARVPPEELYAINGLQFLPFTTVYQLAAERLGPSWDEAAHVVLLPDLLAHRLTGVLGTELTNASTTGLLDARTRQWSPRLLDRLAIPADRLPPLEPPGTVRGTTADGTVVTTVGSHDTASAVVGVPATTDHFAYVSSGTWSLVGLELSGPVLDDAAQQANFTNELGVDDRTRFLRNVGGLWLLQECLRAWGQPDLDTLLTAAARLPAGGPTIDVDDPAFIRPGDMPARIAAAANRPDLDRTATVRCILDSLALAYARTIKRATALADAKVDVVHIVGGGSRNTLLCRLTADATGLPVLAGPVEATALGNVIVQARAHGALSASLDAVRERLAATLSLRRYEPT